MPTILIDRSRFVSVKLILNVPDDVAGRIFRSVSTVLAGAQRVSLENYLNPDLMIAPSVS